MIVANPKLGISGFGRSAVFHWTEGVTGFGVRGVVIAKGPIGMRLVG